MRVLVTFAVDAEFAPWRKLRKFVTHDRNDQEAHTTRIGDVEVTVVLTGVGGKKAWVEATKIIWDANVDVCISSGLAGSLRLEHSVGCVLAARSIDATGWKPRISSDSAIVELASQCGGKVVDSFHSVDRIIVDAAEKHRLGLASDAVEMESGEVMYEAAAFGAKCIAIRAISDAADETLPLDFNRVTTADGDVSIARVLVQVAAHPESVPALIRFGKQSRRAAENLAAFLDRYVLKVAEASMIKPSESVAV
jgi:nucleoside phosphorylase